VSDGGEHRRGDHDAPRLLHRQSEHGYTDLPHRSLPAEPEAVPASYQRRITEQAHRREQARLAAAWVETAEVIDTALDGFAAVAGNDRAIQREVSAVRRSADRLGRRVTAG
jgi:hypothetical protein